MKLICFASKGAIPLLFLCLSLLVSGCGRNSESIAPPNHPKSDLTAKQRTTQHNRVAIDRQGDPRLESSKDLAAPPQRGADRVSSGSAVGAADAGQRTPEAAEAEPRNRYTPYWSNARMRGAFRTHPGQSARTIPGGASTDADARVLNAAARRRLEREADPGWTGEAGRELPNREALNASTSPPATARVAPAGSASELMMVAPDHRLPGFPKVTHRDLQKRQRELRKQLTPKPWEEPPSKKKQPKDFHLIKPYLRGVSSWYGPKFHGKATANGERYNQDGITAAHPVLPMDTRIRVTNLENGRVLSMRVNDRGPYAKGRILDLSKGAAIRLGVFNKGTARVHIEVLRWPPSVQREGGLRSFVQYVVQLAAYPEDNRAWRALEKFRKQHPGMKFLLDRRPGGRLAVIAGPYDDQESALRDSRRLIQSGNRPLVRRYRK